MSAGNRFILITVWSFASWSFVAPATPGTPRLHEIPRCEDFSPGISISVAWLDGFMAGHAMSSHDGWVARKEDREPFLKHVEDICKAGEVEFYAAVMDALSERIDSQPIAEREARIKEAIKEVPAQGQLSPPRILISKRADVWSSQYTCFDLSQRLSEPEQWVYGFASWIGTSRFFSHTDVFLKLKWDDDRLLSFLTRPAMIIRSRPLKSRLSCFITGCSMIISLPLILPERV
jgi:hypothetical protein